MSDTTQQPQVTQSAPAFKPKVGSFKVLKQNMYLNANGSAIKAVQGYLEPANAAEKEICQHFADMNYLKEVKYF